MNETIISTGEVLERFKVQRYRLWIWDQMGVLKITKKIVNGRAMNFYDPQEIEKLLKKPKVEAK